MFEVESNIESTFKDAFDKRFRKTHRGLCFKFVVPGFTGVPDRMLLLKGGTVVFAELKNTGKKERARQVVVQGQIKALGFKVFSTVRTKEQVQEIMAYCEEVLQKNGY